MRGGGGGGETERHSAPGGQLRARERVQQMAKENQREKPQPVIPDSTI